VAMTGEDDNVAPNPAAEVQGALRSVRAPLPGQRLHRGIGAEPLADRLLVPPLVVPAHSTHSATLARSRWARASPSGRTARAERSDLARRLCARYTASSRRSSGPATDSEAAKKAAARRSTRHP